ncbi:hypothetical protein CEP52_004814 [Fusarium oligoseptatum]|uniref:Protein-arginine deiminase C-terminal domain-containing protein n=1 Tax=Fusarium oligoseptatum TaxID=2604345 RepID=A0A428U1G5_9HYPO|nr:hypothetical protein CEP52_004814 [Fusarium oligoseptatum]
MILSFLLQHSMLALVLGAKLALATPTFNPQILADTNRDGIINHLDASNKEIWTSNRGAIFLPNIGDQQHRCPSIDLVKQPLSNFELAACNDATGDRLLTPEYAAPLKTLPLTNISQNAIGSINTTPKSTFGRVRIFWQSHGSSDWSLVDPQITFNATSLGRGFTLAIDGRELVTDSSIWDGLVNITFSVTDGNVTSSDTVVMKQAPVLIHHHLQAPEVVLSTDGNVTTSIWQTGFIDSMQNTLDSLDQDLSFVLFNETDDIWAQDFLEPGYASMPGPNGPISIRVLLRSAQSGRTAGRQVFSRLRGPGIGGFQPGLGSGFGHEEINSGGNIETIPPYTSRAGVEYKSGRVITGKHFYNYPAESMIKFLEAQGVQKPLVLEVGWLAVGHVDEVVQFVPYDNELGFTIAIVDTISAFNLLENVWKDGHGDAKVISYDGDMTPDNETIFIDPEVLNLTIKDLLNDKDFIAVNSYAQSFINDTLDLLLEEVPLSESDILRVPTLWKDVTYPWPITPDGHPPRLNRAPLGERQVKSFFPQSINGLVLGRDYLTPKPWGPVIDGRDILEEAIKDVYARANMTVWLIDDYMSHHVRGGEVHCGTNTLREKDVAWWE